MSQAIKVGIFVTVCLAVLAYLVIKVEDLSLLGGEGQRVVALFDTVVGLDDKAPVRIAGVRVGRVDGIGLEGQKARVELLLEKPVALTAGSRASVSNAGILGDKFIQLILGPADAPPLAEGAVLPGDAPVSFDQALAKLNDLGDSIGGLTDSFQQQDLAPAIGRLIANLEATSADLRVLIGANSAQVTATVGNFERFSSTLAEQLPTLTDRLDQLVAGLGSMVDENRSDLRDSLANLRDITDNVQTSVDHLNSISGQIASGEGTLGKLVYSDQAHDSLVSTLDSIEGGVDTLSDTLGRLNSLEFKLGLEGSYFTDIEESRTALNVQIDSPGKDRFYFVELVDDPRGRVQNRTEVITTTVDGGPPERRTIETSTSKDDFTISAQFGFRLGQADLRAGLFESSGGGALDYHLWDRRVKLSLEAFDFSRQEDLSPRLRLTGRYRLNDSIYVVGGYDDLLESDRSSVFLGAGIRWSDEDLKYLLGSIPKF
ncbi:MAG: MCE family protein [Deltaproteobacteria bacterium]|nr:MCE family protein [Deltaproteobacteria bacterium]